MSVFTTDGFCQNLPKYAWKVVSVDSEERNEDVPGSGPASCIFDNNRNTFWTTAYKTPRTPFPHYVVVDLGGTVQLSSFTFYPRQERYKGKICDYIIYGSLDALHWELLRKDHFRYKSMYDGSPQQVNLARTAKARYIKFVVESELSKSALSIHLAEMDIQGVYISSVFVPLIHVQKNTVIKGKTVHFADSSFVQSTEIRAWEWQFPGGIPSKSFERNPEVKYNTCGTHDVSLTVTSKEGLKKTISLPALVNCLPAPPLTPSKWKLAVSEQELILAHDSIGNLIDNKPKTIWHTAYLSEKKLPHFIRIDLEKETDICGIGYLPRQEGGDNGIFRSYRIFISNDTLDFGKALCRVTETKTYRTIRVTEIPPTKGRYIKIVIDKTFPEGSNFASAGELYVYGKVNNYSIATWIFGGSILTILLILGFLKWFGKKKKAIEEVSQTNPEISTEKSVGIYLFGKVRVLNKGRDVDQLFNKLKQILALITYHTVENQGVSTAELSRQLWAELPEENVASARGTNIKKLRTALQDLPCLEIVTEKKVWKIVFDQKRVYIDFLVYRDLYARLSESLKANRFDEKLIEDFLSVIEKGRFLEDFESEWADVLKNRISEEVIDVLKIVFTMHSKKLSKKLKVRMVDCLFLQDELNVDALRMKLQLYRDESSLGLAKNSYDAYCRKYKQIYNEDFSISLTELIGDSK